MCLVRQRCLDRKRINLHDPNKVSIPSQHLLANRMDIIFPASNQKSISTDN